MSTDAEYRLERIREDINNRIYNDKPVPQRLWNAAEKAEAEVAKAKGES